MKNLYVVTGATGHLGQALIRQLCADGYPVRALVLPQDPLANQLPAEVEIYEGNVLNKPDLHILLADCTDKNTRFIHCAGIIATTNRNAASMYRVNVLGTRNVLDACLNVHGLRFVYVSSVHALPLSPWGTSMAECDTPNPSKVHGTYAKTKAIASAMVLHACQQGLNASIVYPSGILGPYDFIQGHVTRMILGFSKGQIPFGIKGGFDFVDVRDVAMGIMACAESGQSGQGYILANRHVPVAEFFADLHEYGMSHRITHFVPAWCALLLRPLSALLPMFDLYALQTLTHNSIYSHQKARKVLGFSPRPFEQTLADTVQWMRSMQMIA